MQLASHRVVRTWRRKDERVLWPGACPNLATDATRSLHGGLGATVEAPPKNCSDSKDHTAPQRLHCQLGNEGRLMQLANHHVARTWRRKGERVLS